MVLTNSESDIHKFRPPSMSPNSHTHFDEDQDDDDKFHQREAGLKLFALSHDNVLCGCCAKSRQGASDSALEWFTVHSAQTEARRGTGYYQWELSADRRGPKAQ